MKVWTESLSPVSLIREMLIAEGGTLYMKKAEAIGALAGSITGAVGTGIVIYFTGSVWSVIIVLVSYAVGRGIGKSFGEKSSELEN